MSLIVNSSLDYLGWIGMLHVNGERDGIPVALHMTCVLCGLDEKYHGDDVLRKAFGAHGIVYMGPDWHLADAFLIRVYPN